MKVFLRLLRYLKPYWRWVVTSTVCLVLLTTLNLLPPLFQKQIVDDVVGQRLLDRLPMLVLGLIGVYALTQFLRSVDLYLRHVLGEKFILDLRVLLYDYLQRLSISFFENQQTGEIMSRITNDVNALEDFVTHSTGFLIVDLLRLVGTAVILFVLDWPLALLTLLPVPLLTVALRLFNTRVRPIYRQIRDRLGDINAELQDNISGIRVIQAFGQERHELDRFTRRSTRYYEERVKGIRYWSTFFPAMGFVASLGLVIVLGFGAYRVFTGALTLGGLVAFISYVASFYEPIHRLVQIDNTVQQAIAAGERVFELLDTVPEIEDAPEAIELPAIRGAVAFEGVSFRYGTGEEVLRDVSFEMQPGQVVALVGPSGAGKTSIANLIPRFYDPVSGRVTVGGHDVREVRLASLRRQVSVVLQDTFLFNGTVRENIIYGQPDASEEEMIAAAKAAYAHEFIVSLPQGYDTEIGERGVKLSGGQKQRLALARAILTDPRILILDEATSSVDAEAEYLIQQALENVLEGRTALIIAHRLSTIRHADKIIALEDGRIVEVGDHGELLARGGLYSQMYRRQYDLRQ
ncbi:MAG: ABC transporter ATP-binding protein [Chloroflexi bacterium]|nr:ABC transporter ATP-binding protein [Chloroflexota bacterium]